MHVVSDAVIVEPGPAVELEIAPPATTLAIREGIQFTAEARDEFGNVVTGAITWSAAGDGGSITDGGVFTANTLTGTYTDIVEAAFATQDGEVAATASLTVKPGPIESIVVKPSELTLDIGNAQSFQFEITDAFGSSISDALVSWNVPSDIGAMDSDGAFTAGTKAGVFNDAIQVDAVDGVARASAKVNVYTT